MPICGYLLVPVSGASTALIRQLEALPGCEVTRAENRELLAVVTDTADAAAERRIRERIEALAGVQALLLTFGEVEHGVPADGAAG